MDIYKIPLTLRTDMFQSGSQTLWKIVVDLFHENLFFVHNGNDDMENMHDDREDVSVLNMQSVPEQEIRSSENLDGLWTPQSTTDLSENAECEEPMLGNLANNSVVRKMMDDEDDDNEGESKWYRPSTQELQNLTEALGLKDLKCIAGKRGRCVLLGFDWAFFFCEISSFYNNFRISKYCLRVAFQINVQRTVLIAYCHFDGVVVCCTY